MRSGAIRLDIRGAIETDDGQLIETSYNGIVRDAETATNRSSHPELIRTDDGYALAIPTLKTKSAKYDWLNKVLAIGQMTEVRVGGAAHIKYDFFILRGADDAGGQARAS